MSLASRVVSLVAVTPWKTSLIANIQNRSARFCIAYSSKTTQSYLTCTYLVDNNVTGIFSGAFPLLVLLVIRFPVNKHFKSRVSPRGTGYQVFGQRLEALEGSFLDRAE